MNAAHFHLIITHLPIVGAALAIPLLGLALLRGADRGALRAAALVLVLSGAGALLSLWSGEPAEEMVEHLPGISEAAIEAHEERAEVAAALAVIAALAGAGAVYLVERRKMAPGAPVLGALAAALLSAGAMAWTGASGGAIRHPEIGGAAASAAGEGHRAGEAAEAGRAAPARGEAAEDPSRGGRDRSKERDDDD
ncbi:MAG: hypothetical protein IT372_31815 [Polyangiaceae bacterium]|nr:hypothetical protein [Polyangiaceae bacterium]